MKIKKKYVIDSGRQLWKIIPTETGKLIVEERDIVKKQVYFQCVHLDTGKKILKDFQLPDTNEESLDKFWVGIESVYKDIILFHRFLKPDMPIHRGIIAVDINSKKFLWEDLSLNFLFNYDDKIFCTRVKFEAKIYYSINPINSKVVEDYGENFEKINEIKNLSITAERNKGYMFPEIFEPGISDNKAVSSTIEKLRNEFVITGKVEFINVNNLLLLSFHTVQANGKLNNIFKAVDLSTGNYILEETLCKDIDLLMSDSFFVKDDLLFLLFGKNKLGVYGILS